MSAEFKSGWKYHNVGFHRDGSFSLSFTPLFWFYLNFAAIFGELGAGHPKAAWAFIRDSLKPRWKSFKAALA